jgi:predicted NBD/HSP70 family sugar kinase
VKASGGIGCGLIIDGKPPRSYNETAAEIDSVVVDESGLISVETLAAVLSTAEGLGALACPCPARGERAFTSHQQALLQGEAS